MTTNQIELRKLKENERSNLAKEKIDIAKLNETIRNNDLLNSVNITKNELQALADQRLNMRQLLDIKSKLDLAYDQLNEQARTNDVKNQISVWQKEMDDYVQSKRNKNDITTAIISAVGRAAGGLLKVLPINMTMSTSDLGNYYSSRPQEAIKTLTGNITKLDYFDDPRLHLNEDQKDALRERYKNPPNPYEEEIADLKRQLEATKKFKYDRPEINLNSNSNRRYSRQKYKELDETPTDFSNSRGPAYDNSLIHMNGNNSSTHLSVPSFTKNESVVNNNETQHSKHGTTSGGTNYNVSGGHTSQGTIIGGRYV